MAGKVEIRFIRHWCGHEPGERLVVGKTTAGLLDALGVAVRVYHAHDHVRNKPITDAHTVRK